VFFLGIMYYVAHAATVPSRNGGQDRQDSLWTSLRVIVLRKKAIYASDSNEVNAIDCQQMIQASASKSTIVLVDQLCGAPIRYVSSKTNVQMYEKGHTDVRLPTKNKQIRVRTWRKSFFDFTSSHQRKCACDSVNPNFTTTSNVIE
jgi:hypothetical protein